MGDKKSNFSVTCNLLSQYLKQKGSLADLILLDMKPKSIDQQIAKGFSGKSRAPTTMRLLPGVDVSEDNQTDQICVDSPKSMDLFPQHAGFDNKNIPELKMELNVGLTFQEELKAQQLTIFYDGKVFVYDNFPTDKASDLFKMASKEMNTVAQNVGFKVPAPVVTSNEGNSRHNNNNNTMLASTSGSQTAIVTPESDLSKPANASDMPIARRNSLHRFLEKRKDRVNTKAPYQVHGHSSSPQYAKKPEDILAWLGLGRQNLKTDNGSGSSK